MTIYILNALVIPTPPGKTCTAVVKRDVPIEMVKKILNEAISKGIPIVSAVGHESTARIMSQILGIDIKTNRITVTLNEKDIAIIFNAKVRLPEGKVLTESEIKEMLLQKLFEWSIIEVNACIIGVL